MGAFLYGISLQWKLDIRSKTLLITCYIVPLLFFAVMGGIFTSVMPEARYTLIQSMTVFGVTMGALIGLPPSLVEIYSGDIKKVYKANGVPLYLGLVLTNISAYIHLFIMSIILYIAAPLAFNAEIPENPMTVFCQPCCFHCGIPWRCQYYWLGSKRPSKNFDGFHHHFSALYHAFRNYVSNRICFRKHLK